MSSSSMRDLRKRRRTHDHSRYRRPASRHYVFKKDLGRPVLMLDLMTPLDLVRYVHALRDRRLHRR